jgi:hypothetical protein
MPRRRPEDVQAWNRWSAVWSVKGMRILEAEDAKRDKVVLRNAVQGTKVG